MKKEIIQQLYSAFEQAALEVDGVECWSARELCTLLGYSQWAMLVIWLLRMAIRVKSK